MVFPLPASDMRSDILLLSKLEGIAWLFNVDEHVFHLDVHVLLLSKFSSRQPNT